MAGVAGAAVAVVVAVALGGGRAGSRAVARGPITLGYSPPWREVAAAEASSYGVRFSRPVALGEPGATLVAGMLSDGAAVPGGMPPRLAGSLRGGSTRTATRLGGVPAVMYGGRAGRGATEVTMYVIPTDRGDLGLLCSEAAGRTASSRCIRTARTLDVDGARPVPPGPDPALSRRLVPPLRAAAKARSAEFGFVAPGAAARAAGAERIATADRRAAHALAGLAPEPRDRQAVAATSAALAAEARDLDHLSALAESGPRAAYARVASAVESDGPALVRATATLRRTGFSAVPSLHPLAAPPLPSPHRQEPAASASPPPSQAPETFGGETGNSPPPQGGHSGGGSGGRHTVHAKPLNSGGVP